MKKKVVSILLVACMCLGIVACGNVEESNKVEKESNETKVEESQKEEEKKEDKEIPTLTFLFPAEVQEDMPQVLEEANKIIEAEIGVRIDLQCISMGSYGDKMQMMMASNSDYDLCFTSDWLNFYVSAVDNGSLYDLTEYFENDPEFLDVIGEDILRTCVGGDGRYYAVPNIQIMSAPLAVTARKDMLEKYNFDLQSVEHIEDIEPFLEMIKENEPTLYPYRTNWNEAPWTKSHYIKDATLGDCGLVYDIDTGEFMSFLDAPEMLRHYKTMREWYQKGYIRADYASAGDDSTDAAAGKYAVKIETWKPGVEAGELGKEVPYEFKPITKPVLSPTAGTSTMLAINVNSKYPDESFAFIKLLHTNVELYNLLCYGIEGEHWEFNEEGKLHKISDSGYNLNMDWALGNQFNAYVNEGMDADVWEQTKALNESAIATDLAGFIPDTSELQLDISNINAVREEYGNVLKVEDLDAYIEEFKEKLKEAGAESVWAEIEKQAREHIEKTK